MDNFLLRMTIQDFQFSYMDEHQDTIQILSYDLTYILCTCKNDFCNVDWTFCIHSNDNEANHTDPYRLDDPFLICCFSIPKKSFLAYNMVLIISFEIDVTTGTSSINVSDCPVYVGMPITSLNMSE